MYGNSAGFNPGTTREEGVGAEDNGQKPGLVDTVEPAVGSGDYPVWADEGTSADTGARDARVGSKETSLRNTNKLMN